MSTTTRYWNLRQTWKWVLLLHCHLKKERKKARKMDWCKCKIASSIFSLLPKFDKLLLPQASSPSLKIQSWRIGSWKNWIQSWIGKDDDDDDDEDDCVGGWRGGEHWVGAPANFPKQAVVVVVAAAKSHYYKWVFCH